MILLDCWMLIKSLLSPYYAINPWVLALHFKDLYFINKGIDLHFISFVVEEGLAEETWQHTEFLLNYKVYRPFYSEIHWLKKTQWKYLWKKWNPENILQYFGLDSSEETPLYWKAILKDSKYKNIPSISFHFLWNKQMYYKRPLNASTWRKKDLPKCNVWILCMRRLETFILLILRLWWADISISEMTNSLHFFKTDI